MSGFKLEQTLPQQNQKSSSDKDWVSEILQKGKVLRKQKEGGFLF